MVKRSAKVALDFSVVVPTKMLTVTKLVVQTPVSLAERIIMIIAERRLGIPNLDCSVDTITMIATVIKLDTVTPVGLEITNITKNNDKSRHYCGGSFIFVIHLCI